MNDFAAVVSKLGGASEVAAQLGISADGVRKLMKRNAMPSKHWPKLVALAERKKVSGVRPETLFRIVAKRGAQ